jgi:hypothetical protein
VEEPQPATRAPRPSEQARRPAGPPPPDPSRPATDRPASAPADAPPTDFIAGVVSFGQAVRQGVQAVRRGVRTVRNIKLFRTSSALVRWVVMVVAIGFGAALLIALVVQILVSLIPSTGTGG